MGARTKLIVAAATVAALLGAAGCRGDDDRAAGAPEPGAPVATSASATTSAPATTATPVTTTVVATTAAPTSAAPSGAPNAGVPPTPALPPLGWTDCDAGFECATLAVPLDHRQPAGPHVGLPVIRRAATDPAQRIGSVVLNPGGPGGSGVEFLRNAARVFESLNERFDLVSFDPRGVGGSEPAVRCHDDLDDRVDVLGPGGTTEEQLVARIEADKQRCSESGASLLAHVGTNDAARDMDWLRAALGDPQLTYLGFSYGTRLGATYTELYPSGARAVALDGGDIPTQALSRTVGEQYQAFERAFVAFLQWCDGQTAQGCAATGEGGAAATFRTAEAALRESGPMATRLDSRRLTLGEFYLGVVTALYSQSTWRGLGAALRQASDDHDGTALQQLADSLLDRRRDGSYANSADANVAVNCADDPERPTLADALARGKALGATMPYLGPLAVTAFTDCAGWAVPADPVALPTGIVKVPVLVVGTSGDPATPFEWSVKLAAALGPAQLLRHVGEGHTGYFSSACVREAVNAYLLTGALPVAQEC